MPRDTVFSTTTDDLLAGVDWTDLLNRLARGQLLTHDAHGDLVDVATAATVRGTRALSVHWTRGGGFVQLGPHAVADDGTDVAVPGHWVDLDWSQCNRLIRFLRNARDQAFGRPE